MKLNIAYPLTGGQKTIEILDDHKLRVFYDKRMANEVEVDALGEEFKGYVMKIKGGFDLQGFPMMQGVLTNNRVRLLLSEKHKCFKPKRKGERRRKSVRGCIVDANLSVLNLIIVKKGEQELPGITDVNVPRRFGPIRASKIIKLFNLTKKDNVRDYIIKRPLKLKPGETKQRFRVPKIQSLLTPHKLRQRLYVDEKRIEHRRERRRKTAAYLKLVAQRRKEAKIQAKKTRLLSSSSQKKSSSISKS